MCQHPICRRPFSVDPDPRLRLMTGLFAKAAEPLHATPQAQRDAYKADWDKAEVFSALTEACSDIKDPDPTPSMQERGRSPAE